MRTKGENSLSPRGNGVAHIRPSGTVPSPVTESLGKQDTACAEINQWRDVYHRATPGSHIGGMEGEYSEESSAVGDKGRGKKTKGD